MTTPEKIVRRKLSLLDLAADPATGAGMRDPVCRNHCSTRRWGTETVTPVQEP